MDTKRTRSRTPNRVFTKLIVALLFLSLFIGCSSAAPTVFFGEDTGLGESTRLTSHPNSDAARDAFLAQLINPVTENLEDFADETSAPLGVGFGGAWTATLKGSGYVNTVSTGTNGVGRFPISGDNYWETGSEFYLEFTEPQVAFGFYGIDVGDFQGQLTITYEDGTAETVTVPHTVSTAGGNVIYYGFIDLGHPFVKVTFGNTAAGTDYFGFDDFTIGTKEQVSSIPEFPTVAFPMIAILGMLFFFQRRKE